MHLTLEEHIDLQPHNTFHLPCTARYFLRIHHITQLPPLIHSPLFQSHPHLILGSGSNILFATPEYDSIVLKNEIPGIEPISSTTPAHTTLKVSSGVLWTSLVDYCLTHQLGGIENLALIPGTVGAAPVQNVGAYGVEIASVVDSVEVVDLRTGETRVVSNQECEFGYRDSIFKRGGRGGEWFITAVRITLTNAGHGYVPNTMYGSVRETLEQDMGIDIDRVSIQDVAKAVCRLRRRKLPDPQVLGNAGSFFVNPLLQGQMSEESFVQRHPGVLVFRRGDGRMVVPAGELIEACGWKGWRASCTGVYEAHALILVNYGGAKGKEVLELAGRISDSVWDWFGIRLRTEITIILGQ
ncbi:hypothetical protein FE257_011346 [Aspergillus nanangensis]|uniref:UDP-N-acetylmuramate dehydrogenase n=1 Tax=Aspergillus nanangensis TaxID=2582783 RepID=A0AAD4GQQ0_ASPNN|nr:hypothetical protein FE257_011346 [Aspergillus nanangensis]